MGVGKYIFGSLRSLEVIEIEIAALEIGSFSTVLECEMSSDINELEIRTIRF